MNQSLPRRKRRLPASDQEVSPSSLRDENAENASPTPLFFPSGVRRQDLHRQDLSECIKRLRVDAPVFSERGLRDGLAAREPAANEALMRLATGELLYYGEYFEQNKLLRQLTFEREARLNFGEKGNEARITTRSLVGGLDDEQDVDDL